jgi:hypothetical protein
MAGLTRAPRTTNRSTPSRTTSPLTSTRGSAAGRPSHPGSPFNPPPQLLGRSGANVFFAISPQLPPPRHRQAPRRTLRRKRHSLGRSQPLAQTSARDVHHLGHSRLGSAWPFTPPNRLKLVSAYDMIAAFFAPKTSVTHSRKNHCRRAQAICKPAGVSANAGSRNAMKPRAEP